MGLARWQNSESIDAVRSMWSKTTTRIDVHPLIQREATMRRVLFCGALTFLLAAFSSTAVHAQTAYGIDDVGLLFRFDVNNPSSVTEIGNVGFVPRGIDFRPSSNILYGLTVGPTTSQLYTIDINTAVPTAVGAGFATTTGNYDLSGATTTIGFDFNPTTLQVDNSMRIRLISSTGANLRLNSSTGLVAAADGALTVSPANIPQDADGAAYINNIATAGGTTALYDMDSLTNSLYIQNPPNNGVLTSVGAFGVTIDDSLPGIGFDIFTDPNNADPGIGGDSAFAVLQRRLAPIGNPGAYLLYDVNLATGAITNGAIVGSSNNPYSFEGGFAVQPVPEPTSAALIGLGIAFYSLRRRRR